MSIMSVVKILTQNLKCILPQSNRISFTVCKAWYAAGGLKGKMMAAPQKKLLEVETDTEKLCNFVCGANYFKEGEDPKILPDSEYPEWLFDIRLDRQAPDINDISKDDPYYWIRLRKINIREQNKERKFANMRQTKRIF